MPTASTSILLGCNEMFEPIQELVFTRKTISGDFTSFNKYLIADLEKLGIWNEDLAQQITIHESLQPIDLISLGLTEEQSTHIKRKYLTIFEISQKLLIDYAADRQAYCDQSQSMNLYWKEGILSNMIGALVYGWQKGLKTGVYYTKVKSQTKNDKKLSFMVKKEKPKNSDFECFNCSA
jgi:ribonucleotide reductase alpha subunit